MGWHTALRGTLRLTPEACRDLLSLRGLGWTFGHDSVSDYLRGGVSYDPEAQRLTFAAEHKMHHHRAFFDLLAAFKDIDGTDDAEQIGETYDAWFRTGRFYVRVGAWAYAGEGEMVTVGARHGPAIVRPARAELDHVRDGDWNEAPPLLRAIRVEGDSLELTWWRRAPSRVEFWNFDVLSSIWGGPAASRIRLGDGGAWLAWLDDAGREAFRISARDLARASEEMVVRP